jgi:hypothetical protein
LIMRLTVEEWAKRVWIPLRSMENPNLWWVGGARAYVDPGLVPHTSTPSPPFPIRYSAVDICFGQDALEYDRKPEATSLLTDDEVAALLRKTGNPPCPHPEYLAEMRSLITAWWVMLQAESKRPKEKQHLDERISRAVGVLRSSIPRRVEALKDEIAGMPEDEHAPLLREIDRLRRLLEATDEASHLPPDKDFDGPFATPGDLIRQLAAIYDNAYGATSAWKKSPKALFIREAAERVGWKQITAGAVEKRLLRTPK